MNSVSAKTLQTVAPRCVSARRRFAVALCFAGLLTICGCFGGGDDGPQREAIFGTVTREGIPVDDGLITITSKGGGPGAQAAIVDGEYEFTDQTGPVAGSVDVKIIQHARREKVPEGTPLKDANFIPEDRFKGKHPRDGWHFTEEIKSGHSEPVDFEILYKGR